MGPAALLKEWEEMIEAALGRFLPAEEAEPRLLHRAMRYTVQAKGKRVRPLLCLAAAQAVGCPVEKALPLACAVEFLHSYSIIHDDLPAMDDDNYRRGQLASHKVFGEALAILAGDALLTEAFHLFSNREVNKGLEGGVLLEVVHRAAWAAGSLGMAGGQVDDLCPRGELNANQVESIHRRKTGALITLAVVAGALAGNASQEQLCALTRYGERLGLAFQISDDILDIEETGMSKGVSYPAVVGEARARQRVQALVDEALEAVKEFDLEAEPLREMARLVLARV